jgi:hypothetical protein
MKKWATRAIVVAWLASILGPTSAQSYFCDRPSKPYIPSYSTDKYEMENAQSEVERYTRRMKDYVECLNNENSDAISEHKRTISNWNDAVSSFNNR